MNNTDKDLDAVAQALDIANEQGMAAEVVWSAMRIYAKFISVVLASAH